MRKTVIAIGIKKDKSHLGSAIGVESRLKPTTNRKTQNDKYKEREREK